MKTKPTTDTSISTLANRLHRTGTSSDAVQEHLQQHQSNLALMLDQMDQTPWDLAVLKAQRDHANGTAGSVLAAVAHAAPQSGWLKRTFLANALEEPVLPVAAGALPLGFGGLLSASSSSFMLMAGTAMAPVVYASAAVGAAVGIGGQKLLLKYVERKELRVMQEECAMFATRMSDVADRASLHRLSAVWRDVPGSTSKFETVRKLHSEITDQLIAKFYALSQADHASTDAAVQALFDQIVEGNLENAEYVARQYAEKITDNESSIVAFVDAVVLVAKNAMQEKF